MASLGSYLTVGGLCAVKYMIGVASGLAMDLSFIELFLCYFIGGSAGMVLYTLFGDRLLSWWKGRKSQAKDFGGVVSSGKDWKVRIWERYGLIGVAFITPPILSQPVGTALSLGFGAPAHKVILAMCGSMLWWSLVFAYAGDALLQWFPF